MSALDFFNVLFTVIANLVFLTLALSPAIIALRQRRRRLRTEQAINLQEPTSWEY
jgi:hypothetical protein